MLALHKEDIKAGIRRKFGTLLEFERRRGLPTGATKGVLSGRKSAKTVAAIADELGVPAEVIQKSVSESIVDDDKSTEVDSHRLNAGAK